MYTVNRRESRRSSYNRSYRYKGIRSLVGYVRVADTASFCPSYPVHFITISILGETNDALAVLPPVTVIAGVDVVHPADS
jgi:hypothetical protein